jgi:small-conductance mechanosensitive channel
MQNWLLTFVYFIGFYVAFKIFRKVILVWLKAITAKTPGKFDDELVKVFANIHPRFYDLAALYCAVKTMHLNTGEHRYLDLAFVIIFIIQLTLSVQELLGYLLSKLLRVDHKQPEDQTAFNGVYILVKIGVWGLSLIAILSSFGINISALIASLGIGGIAVALAAQNILNDIVSSFSIYLDKPFAIGDVISVGDITGTVRKIGLKTTRLESVRGEELIIANRELTASRIQNFCRMQRRQALFNIRIAPDTAHEQLKAIPDLISQIIISYQSQGIVKLERVNLKEITSTHIDYEVLYYHLSADYNEYMRVREEINLKILETLNQHKVKLYFALTPSVV